MQDTNEVVEITVQVPVAVNLRIDRSKAESMSKEDLCRMVDNVLQDASHRLGRIEEANISVGYDIGPSWDSLPEDECELTYSEDGLFS